MKNMLLLTCLVSSFTLSSQSLREIYQEGVTAYEQKDFQTFKKKMQRIDSMRPNYPPVVYNLASAHALLNEKENSLKRLNQFILMNAFDAFEEDNDFANLQGEVAFYDLLEKRKSLANEIPAIISQELPLMASHPESITYSKKLKAYLVGSVRDGKIWLIKEGQAPQVWAESAKDSWSVMGLKASRDNKVLWICTSAMSNYERLNEADKGKVSVLKYDLKKGTLLDTFVLPSAHTFGDLITDKKGNVYISDGTANHIYQITTETGKLELFKDLSEEAFNLQGLCFDSDESSILVSDYVDGIYKIDLQTKEFVKLSTADDVLIKGIDGLYYQNGQLIAMHNGTKPNRVVKYTLNSTETGIVKKQIIAQGGMLGEPTQGTFVGGKFYYLVNSPWAAYDQDGHFDAKAENVLIGVIE